MKSNISFSHLSDSALAAELLRVVASERQITARFVALLAELDRRKLHLALGYSSLFDYCLKALKLTEHETCNRIEAARAIRSHPLLLDRLADGQLSLTAIRLLRPHLTNDNAVRIISEARGRNVEGIKLLIARLKPQPAVPSVVRKLPEPKPVLPQPPTRSEQHEEAVSLSTVVAQPPPPSRRPVVAPLSESCYKLQVTISAPARERLRQIQDLMRHRVPTGDPAVIVEKALELLHAQLLKEKAAEVARPRRVKPDCDPAGRHIPAAVKREVWRRDEGRCAFIGTDGRKCGSTAAIEFHHLQPFAVGGASTPANLALRCRAHNGFDWEQHLDTESAALAAGLN